METRSGGPLGIRGLPDGPPPLWRVSARRILPRLTCLRRLFPAEDAAPAIAMRLSPFLGDVFRHRRPDSLALELARLLVQSAQGTDFFLASQLRVLPRGFEHPDGFII